ARAERDHVLRLRHLLVEPLDRRRHLVGHRAADDHEIGLPGTGSERDHPEPDEVVAGHRGRDELDRAAGKTEVEDPEAVAATPVEHEPDRRRRNARGGPDALDADRHGRARRTGGAHTHVSTPLRHAYRRPTARKPRKTNISPSDSAPNPASANTVAQGKRNTASTAKTT